MALKTTHKSRLNAGTESLLTLADLLKLQSDLKEDERLLAELPARVAEKRKRLDAAMLFAPKDFDSSVKGVKRIARTRAVAQQPVSSPVTWIGEVARIVKASSKGLAHREILEEANKTSLGLRKSNGDKGFYNAIGRLAKKGKIVKHGGLIYWKKLADELIASGQILPDASADVARRRGSGGALVVEVLSKNAQGLTAPDLKKELSALPNAPQSIRAHGQYIYNILGTLIGSGTVTREGGVYKLTQQRSTRAPQ